MKRTSQSKQVVAASRGQQRPKNKNRANRKNGLPSDFVRARLSTAATAYAAALRDPFDGPIVGVPSTFPPIPSLKMRVFARGSLVTGSGGTNPNPGYGFVLINPSRCSVNDVGGVYTSSHTYNQDGFPAALTDVGVVVSGTNSPFVFNDMGAATDRMQYRVVAIGLRTWYMGTQLNLSGYTLAIRQPDNESLLGAKNNTLMGFDSCRRALLNDERSPVETLWIPTRPIDLEYRSTVEDQLPLGHLIKGYAGEIYGFEVYAIYEYVGRNVQGKSLSVADPAGFAAVITAAETQGDTWIGSARAAAQELMGLASQQLRYLSGQAVRAIGTGVGQMATAYMANRASHYLTGNTEPNHNRILVEEVVDNKFQNGYRNTHSTSATTAEEPTQPRPPVTTGWTGSGPPPGAEIINPWSRK